MPIHPPARRGGVTLDRATSTATQTGISATTDVTGLSITFTVTDRPVTVTATLPWVVTSDTTTSSVVTIADAANTAVSLASGPAGSRGEAIVKETLTTPGTYTRKVRIARGIGAGTVSNNAAATTIASLEAIEQ